MPSAIASRRAGQAARFPTSRRSASAGSTGAACRTSCSCRSAAQVNPKLGYGYSRFCVISTARAASSIS